MPISAFDQLPDPVLIHSSGKWVYANPAAATLLRVAAPEDLVGRSILDFVPASYHDVVLARARGVEGGTESSRLDQQLLAADGTLIDVAISGTPFALRDTTGVLIVARDITPQKHAEQLLRESEQRFRTMIESAFQLVLLVNAAGVVTYASSSLLSLLGYTADEIIGAEFFAFVHADDLADVVEHFLRLVRDPHVRDENVLRVRNRAGAWRTFESSAVNLIEEPAVAGIVVHARDITERLDLTSEVERFRRVESLGRVASTVAHEFNNLLMSIAPYAEVLKRRATGDPQIEKTVAVLSNAVSRGTRITERIRQFGKGVVLRKQRFDVAAWLSELAPTLRQMLPANIELTTCLSPGIGALSGDPDLLAQVITNLVMNACDAMPSGGAVDLAAQRLPECGTTSFIDLQVSDTGVGIAPEDRQRVFDPFFTTKHTGTGLGLAVAQQIIAAHGGRMMIDSVVGAGTKITILLPA